MSAPETNRQKIALLMAHAEMGGVQRVMIDIANGLNELGCDVDFVCDDAGGSMLDQLAPAIRKVALGKRRGIFQTLPLTTYLRREKPHALLSAMELFNIIAIIAGKLAGGGTRIVLSCHTLPSVLAAEGLKRQHRRMPALMKRFYPFADGIIAVSRAVAEDVTRTAGLKPGVVQVIPNPVDLDRVRRLGAETPRHPWLQAGHKVILASGRFVPRHKNFEALIEAFALVRRSLPARLIILGEGPERPRLEQLIDDLGLTEWVSLPGSTGNPYAEMSAADVFCLSSRWEGFGVVLIEALALGRPVVAVDCPGAPRDILRGGELGTLVEPDNIEALAAALRAALATPQYPSATQSRLESMYGAATVAAHYKQALLGAEGTTN